MSGSILASSAPHRAARFLVCALLALALFGCRDRAPTRSEQALARVGDDTISVSWFERTYVDYLLRTGGNDTMENRRAHLAGMIDVVLLAQEAQRRGLPQDSTFVAFRTREEKKALGTEFFHEAFIETLPEPTDQELRLAFARWKAQVVVRHLFFTDPQSAQQSWQRLEAGKSFLEEARDVYGLASVDSSAGYLGPIRYFQVDDAFSETAFGLEEGAYSQPVRTRFGWHIIRSERVIVNPLLTEDEYQTRKAGISSQFRLRRRRLEGDRFVQSFMQGLGVEVRPDAIRAMASLIDDLTIEAVPSPEIVSDENSSRQAAIDSLRAVMDAGTVLATYTYRGRQRPFTAGEYVAWLEDLPFQEARNRTGASVGRAMRNEVFAMEGARRGLDNENAARAVREATTTELAKRLRYELRATPGHPPDSLLRLASERLGYSTRSAFLLDFDAVTFNTRQGAEQGLLRIRSNPSAAPAYPGYATFKKASSLELPPWARGLSGLEPGWPTLLALPDGEWAVVTLRGRSELAPDEEGFMAALRPRIAPLVAEFELLRDLRRTPVSVDSTLFRQLAEGLDVIPPRS